MFTIFLATVLAAPNPARNLPPALVGHTVMFRQTGLSAAIGGPDGKVGRITLNITDAVVLREESGWLCIRNLNQEVWVARTDALSAKEAIDYFSDQIKEGHGMSWGLRVEGGAGRAG